MDEQEVERVAKLMHETHRAIVVALDQAERAFEGHTPISTKPWEAESERYRERIRYVARAVLADLTAVPTAIVQAGQ